MAPFLTKGCKSFWKKNFLQLDIISVVVSPFSTSRTSAENHLNEIISIKIRIVFMMKTFAYSEEEKLIILSPLDLV